MAVVDRARLRALRASACWYGYGRTSRPDSEMVTRSCGGPARGLGERVVEPVPVTFGVVGSKVGSFQ